ncbi:hypothetical protein HOD38_00775 [archaeon]|jgi:hypothetical protein|nr:hypothetical protein [archaeon]MBT4396779.1 hypothetical protein [archaeon]MBT4441104.1 hypothetical protein [archaeon]
MAEQVQQTNFDPQIVFELVNRIRVLESKQNLFGEKLLVMNQNMIEEYNKIMKEIKRSNTNFKKVEESIGNVKTVVRHLSEEAGKFAIKEDVKILEKYIKLWDPLKFVTENDVMEMLDNARHTNRKSTTNAKSRIDK